MDISLVMMKYIGFFYLLFGIALVSNNKIYDLLLDIFDNDSKLFILGLLTILFSLPIVIFHNIWNDLLTGFISFLGWVGLFKGFFQITFTSFVKKKAKSNLSILKLKIRGFLSIIIGLFFLFYSYFFNLFNI